MVRHLVLMNTGRHLVTFLLSFSSKKMLNTMYIEVNQFQMPLEENFSNFLLIWSTLKDKSEERKKNTSYKQNSTADSALMSPDGHLTSIFQLSFYSFSRKTHL